MPDGNRVSGTAAVNGVADTTAPSVSVRIAGNRLPSFASMTAAADARPLGARPSVRFRHDRRRKRFDVPRSVVPPAVNEETGRAVHAAPDATHEVLPDSLGVDARVQVP